MDDAPPKALKQHMEKHRELARSTASLVMSQLGLSAAPDPEAEPLPVLQEFRDFLEAERRQARRRVFILAAFFTLLLLLITAAGIAFTVACVRGIRGDFRDVQRHVARFEELSAALNQDTRAAITGVQQHTVRVQADLDARHRSILQAGADLESRGLAQADRFRQMNDLLAAMEFRQLKLQREIQNLREEWPRMTNSLKPAPDIPAPAETASSSKTPLLAGSPQPALPPTILVSIAVPGQAAPVTCRLPLPE
ncbi:MAG: hypothetical protein QME60_01420 [Verrucomicrobiota bacterium]|nr:hypothetical protein [Verrucomicrobiota bacterium]